MQLGNLTIRDPIVLSFRAPLSSFVPNKELPICDVLGFRSFQLHNAAMNVQVIVHVYEPFSHRYYIHKQRIRNKNQ